MNNQEYIESGILELYVFGQLSDQEFEEVTRLAQENREIQNEIKAIEKAIISFSGSISPTISTANYEKIRQKLNFKNTAKKETPKKSNLFLYLGYAGLVLALIAAGYLYQQLEIKNNELSTSAKNNTDLQKSVLELTKDKETLTNAITVMRDPNLVVVDLSGQEIAPDTFAKIYWNKITAAVHLDATGLPEPPEGMTYQVWALQLNPFSPTSLGTLDDFNATKVGVFTLENAFDAEAFGISLEPTGGSDAPNLEQIYTLGKI